MVKILHFFNEICKAIDRWWDYRITIYFDRFSKIQQVQLVIFNRPNKHYHTHQAHLYMVHIQNNMINQWQCMHMPPLSIMSPFINLHYHPPNFTLSPTTILLQYLSLWSSLVYIYISPPTMNLPTSVHPPFLQPDHLPHTKLPKWAPSLT